jgi:hypothetical protein
VDGEREVLILIQIEQQESRVKQKAVFLLNKEQIDHYWSDIITLLGECPMYYEYFTPEWTYAKAQKGDIQIWGLSDGTIRGLVVTQILIFPAQKVFEVLAATGIGLLEYFDEMEEVFEYIAADTGCQTIAARVRPGLERLLTRRKGAYKILTTLSRPVGKKKEH